ncbi:MAG: MBL fold metallo-hydrolase [Bacteroidetes bacterium]|nr:MBL fold metallo-hydrolase [Bacteroidota bacterium]
MKYFLVLLIFLLVSCSGNKNKSVESIELGVGLYRLTVDGINAVALIDSAGNTLLVDNFKGFHSPLLLKRLKKLGSKRIVYMINSHIHGDHCGGNKTINEGIIISHVNTRKLLETDHISVFWQDTSRAFPSGALPRITITDFTTIHFAGEEIDLIPFTGGHTNNDIVVYFKKSKVMHLSDLLFSIGFPAIDAERGGNVIRFAENLKTICNSYPDDLTFVAGHGCEISKQELKDYQQMVESSARVVQNALQVGLNVQQIKQGKLLNEWRNYSKGYFSCDDWIEIVNYSLAWADSLGDFYHLTSKTTWYIDSIIPEKEPLIFAPGTITTQGYEGCSGFNREMDRFYFQRWLGNTPNLYVTGYKQGVWSKPERITTSFTAPIYDFAITPDGSRLVFASPMQIAELGDNQTGHNIFLLELKGKEWQLNSDFTGSGINTPYHDSYPCLAANGNMYFFSNRPGGFGKTDIYFSEFSKGLYSIPVNLGEKVNTQYDEWDPFIAPDESYLLFCSKKLSGQGEDDLYISFNVNSQWSDPISLGANINTRFSENRPNVTPDDKFLFFTRNINGNRDIYWISAKIIEELRPKK